jgi:hypothetical protein
VAEGLGPLLAECAEAERELPGFVRRELEALLVCGRLEEGFCRVRCPSCGFERLVPFSCKGRSLCPSCMGRQMAETAAHLVDEVIPAIPMRHWTITFPQPLRYLFAYDSSLTSEALGAYVGEISRFLRRKAKELFELSSVNDAHPGAITVIHRAGGAMNLNPHFHTVATDGVFLLDPDGKPSFRALPAPTDKEIAAVVERTMKAVLLILAKRGLWVEEEAAGDDALAQEEPALSAIASASVRGIIALGPRAGKRVLTLRAVAAGETVGTGRGSQVNLHAGRRVSAHDRQGLERLLRSPPPAGTPALASVSFTERRGS